MSKGKVTPVFGGNVTAVCEREAANLKKNLPSFIEYVQVFAKVHKAKFDALVAEGFTEAQALELCKTLF